MNIQTITQDIENRFSKPLEEFYKRRIIVWLDSEKEFEDMIESIEINNVKVIILNKNNNFFVKKTICYDDLESNYLIYCPVTFNQPDDNWLFDVFQYSEEFRSDRASLTMEDLNISDTVELRDRVKKYSKFFNAEERKSKINTSKKFFATDDLDFELLKIISGSNEKRLSEILINIFNQSLDIEENNIYQDFLKYAIDDIFWSKVSKATGYYDESPNLKKLLIHILLTASSRNLRNDVFIGLESYIKSAYDTFCYEFISIWTNSIHKERMYELTSQIEDYINFSERTKGLSADELEDCIVFPKIDELIIFRILKEINKNVLDSNRIERILEKRRVKPWYLNIKNYYDGIYYYNLMYQFWKNNVNVFHYSSSREIWDSYTSKYFILDTYYRKFQLSFQKSLKNSVDNLDDEFKNLADKVDNLYKNWFLTELNDNWNKMTADDFEKFGKVPELRSQTDFYKLNILSDTNRKFVIISDALRYEVASELKDELQTTTQSKIQISTMLGIYPTITKFGMAALLPHKELTLKKNSAGNISVLLDGQLSDSGNRENILKQYNQDSIVINADDLISMKRNDRQDLVKGKEVIYIYHNKIDSTSHNHEDSVFNACEDTIIEIKEIIRVLVNDLSAIHILVTSDHGFNYTYKPFEEMDKIDKNTFGKKAVELGRRYVITEKGTETDYLLPVNILNGTSEYEAYSPREIKRFKAGGGLNFVHGGLSLQEIVVPLIKYQHLRNNSKEYQKNREQYDTKPVELRLLSSNHRTSNMIFSLEFYQTESISNLVESVTYDLYFIDSEGKKVSDVKKIIADKQSILEKARVTRVTFNLISKQYNKSEEYYLVIHGLDSRLVPQKIPFTIDIAASLDGFDFFS